MKRRILLAHYSSRKVYSLKFGAAGRRHQDTCSSRTAARVLQVIVESLTTETLVAALPPMVTLVAPVKFVR